MLVESARLPDGAAHLTGHPASAADGSFTAVESTETPGVTDSAESTNSPQQLQPARQSGLGERAEQLLVSLSVYREPADRNAVLFQAGEHDWTAARAPDKRGPAPPFQAPADLADSVAACVSSGLLTVVGTGRGEFAAADDSRRYVLDRWIASNLQERLAAAGRAGELAAAHQRAAEYWQWRAAAWPQDRRSDVHDLLEARQHLFSAGALDAASELTGVICAQLHAWGDLGREAELILSTLDLLPKRSAGRAGWLHELGAVAQVRRDFTEAGRRFNEAAALFGSLGDERGVARCQHSLGVLAQAQGEYRQAERHYRLAAASDKRAGQAAPTDGDPQPAADPASAAAPVAPAANGDRTAPRFEPAAGADRLAVLPTKEVRRPGHPAIVPVQPAVEELRPTAATIARAVLPKLPPPATAEAAEPGRLADAPADALAEPELAKSRHVWPLFGSAAALIGAAVGVLAFMAVAHQPPDGGQQGPAKQPAAGQPAVVRRQAAGWAASQLSRDAIVACDPVMCAALRRAGIPAGDTLTLSPGESAGPSGSGVVVATAAVRGEFGRRLVSVYAPLVLAAFGSGGARIEIRVSAPDGAAAYLRQVSADQAARRSVGSQLADNSRVSVDAGSRTELTGGRVDMRLLSALATAADIYRLHVVAFGDAGPGASPQIPLRSAEVTLGGGHPTAAWLRSVTSFMNAQQQPFRPAFIHVLHAAGRREFLLIEFAAPSPLGLLSSGTAPAPPTRP